MFHWKLEEVEFPLCVSWHLLPQRSISEISYSMSWLLTIFPSKLIHYPCQSLLFHYLIHHDFLHVYLSESHIFFLIFSLSFSFWIKPFSFLSMTTLLYFPCHKNYLTMRPFIYSPTTHYVQLVLADVGFLKAHLSTSLAPSTSTPYLG